jgi:hypothetical protein
MANNDTLKNVGVTEVKTVTKNGEVLADVPAWEFNDEEKAAIRAIALALSTSRKPVSPADVVKDLKKSLQTKAKTTFYTPFETEWRSTDRANSAMKKVNEFTLTEYMHKRVMPSGWSHMTNLGCKLEVMPPKTNPASKDSPVDTPKE